MLCCGSSLSQCGSGILAKPGKAFSPQVGIRSSNHFFTFQFLGVRFALLDPDPAEQNKIGYMRIRIHNTGEYPTTV